MTLAQVSDVVFLFLLPVMLKRLGYKMTIALGILAWVLRYFLLAGERGRHGPADAAHLRRHPAARRVLRLPVHRRAAVRGRRGERADPRRRAGVHRVHPVGRGAFVGTMLAGRVLAAHKLPRARAADRTRLAGHLDPAGPGGGGGPGLFLLFFRNPARDAQTPTQAPTSPRASPPRCSRAPSTRGRSPRATAARCLPASGPRGCPGVIGATLQPAAIRAGARAQRDRVAVGAGEAREVLGADQHVVAARRRSADRPRAGPSS